MQQPDAEPVTRDREHLEALPQVVWLCHPDGTPKYLNRRWEEFTGRPVAAALDGGFSDVIHPDDRGRVMAAWAEATASGSSLQIEWRMLAADGSYRWVVGHANPLRDGEGRIIEWVGTTTDVHARRTLEEEAAARLRRRLQEGTARLEEAEARFRFLFQHSPEGITLLDPHDSEVPWRIVEANDAFCRMNGYAREELIGKPVDVLHEENAPLAERMRFVEKLRRVGVVTLRAEHTRRDGTPLTIEAVTTLVTLDGRELVLGADRDVTERERAQAALAQANAELQVSNAELERFAYTISHDLRAPLLSIQGMSALLGEALDAGDREEARFLLGRVAQNAERMGDLLSAVLAVSRAGRRLEDPQEQDLGTVVAQVLNELEARLTVRRVSVSIPSAWPTVHYPPSELYQVTANLIGNALKWAGRVRGQVPDEPAARDARVQVTWEGDGRFVRLRVSDNGPGVPPAYREKVFALFQKLDPKSEGSGVGLAIVKRIVERHGGRAWVEEGPLGGASFAVQLPTGS